MRQSPAAEEAQTKGQWEGVVVKRLHGGTVGLDLWVGRAQRRDLEGLEGLALETVTAKSLSRAKRGWGPAGTNGERGAGSPGLRVISRDLVWPGGTVWSFHTPITCPTPGATSEQVAPQLSPCATALSMQELQTARGSRATPGNPS